MTYAEFKKRHYTGLPKPATSKITEYRERIDEIDREIAKLYVQRLGYSAKIGRTKLAENVPVSQPVREHDVYQNVLFACGDDAFLEKEVTKLYDFILADSKRIQGTIKANSVKCGLLGHSISYSASPELHEKLGLYTYDLFDVEPDKLDEFFKKGEFAGLNVTVPYKREVLKYCDELDDAAREAGAVNTIMKRDGKIFGYNTDCFGFRIALKAEGIDPAGKKCIVLGSGGASAAVVRELKSASAEIVTVVSRTGEVNYDNVYKICKDYDILVNATPVGMALDAGHSPIDIKKLELVSVVMDLIYNPFKTKLIMDAKLSGKKTANGLMMLAAQAAMSAAIFNGEEIDEQKLIKKAYELKENYIFRKKTIVLTGLPGSGKTTVGREMASSMGRHFIDLDAMVEAKAGMSIPELIEEFGEDTFRAIEKKCLQDLAADQKSRMVIALGGGTVLDESNYYVIAPNSVIIMMDTPKEKLATGGRPITDRDGIDKIIEERMPIYERWADVKIKI